MAAPKVNKPKPNVPPPPPKKGPTVHGKAALIPKHIPKQFTIGNLSRKGKKIILYSDSGMGKSTLGMLLDNPAFIAIDDGVYLMTHPVTGEKVQGPQGVETYQDVRDVFQSDILDPFDNIVIDTITDVQHAAIPWILMNNPKEGGKEKAENLEDYGWHKGYRHWYEAMEGLIFDLNRWLRKGKNIILLAQSTGIKMSSEYGDDYKKVGPDLYHEDKWSIYKLFTRWVDYILRINYTDMTVNDKKKRATGGSQRAVYLKPTVQYEAKSRIDYGDAYECVSFANKTDDSIWRLILDGD